MVFFVCLLLCMFLVFKYRNTLYLVRGVGIFSKSVIFVFPYLNMLLVQMIILVLFLMFCSHTHKLLTQNYSLSDDYT